MCLMMSCRVATQGGNLHVTPNRPGRREVLEGTRVGGWESYSSPEKHVWRDCTMMHLSSETKSFLNLEERGRDWNNFKAQKTNSDADGK